MPIVKKRNQQTETRLLLESDGPVELPPAAVEDGAVLVQFENLKQYTPELLEVLREGTTADPVPVMMDGSTFMVHGRTRTFWIKIWHTAQSEMKSIERVQVISCLPSTRGLQIVVDTHEDDEPEESDEDYTDT